MNWSDWFVFLDDGEKKLAAQYPQWVELTSLGDLADQYCDIVFDDNPVINQAIYQFAETGTWPPLTKSQGAALRERIDFAIDLATLFSQCGVKVPKAKTRISQIKFLLIDAWGWCGSAQRHSVLEIVRDAGSAKNPHDKN